MVVQFIAAWEMVGVTLIKRWELAALERYYEGYLTASGQGISRDRTGWGVERETRMFLAGSNNIL